MRNKQYSNIIFDYEHEQPFGWFPAKVYEVAIIAWVAYKQHEFAKYYGIDAWVCEIAEQLKSRVDITYDTILLGNAIYIFFQLDVLLVNYENWLILGADVQYLDDSMMITIEGYPGECHGRATNSLGYRGNYW